MLAGVLATVSSKAVEACRLCDRLIRPSAYVPGLQRCEDRAGSRPGDSEAADR